MRKRLAAAMVLCISLATQAAPLRLPAASVPVPDGGSVTALGQGALIRYRGWLLAVDDAAADARADVRLASASGQRAPRAQAGRVARDLPVWTALELVKGATRLRITALPGPGSDEAPALLLDFGDGDYRIVIPAHALAPPQHAQLAQRFPGADLALLLQEGRRVMLPLGSSRVQVFGAEQAVPYLFSKVKR
ncbi:hypothetical protein O0880_00280 [Janthinobacterium sp. SUN118]|uniref:hypothetical protein n=1 Tax=Janthinobacterium sp. SUN118 TaxID=3004100 RepID=UPI0025B26B4E|nr:hypothetical protein [Janthinobacterium sp. SUN118]MDN2707848.1 hypothetical protein [Janthinobacterium sp. SUN118]